MTNPGFGTMELRRPALVDDCHEPPGIVATRAIFLEAFMSTVFLPRTRHSLYARTRFPLTPRPFLGGREVVWCSLKTRDNDEARVRPEIMGNERQETLSPSQEALPRIK